MGNRQKNARIKQKKLPEARPETVFALDIGTRSVIGIVGVPEGDKIRVLAVESEEHQKRAMTDGQIEDIEQVSLVSRHVKERLEARLGCRLKHVCVAAAGRALKTQRASFEIKLEPSKAIQQDVICRLEAGAIEAAERGFEPESGAGGEKVFYLVGYSVVEYRLDDYPISSLLEHRGKTAGVDVIATFLPREVVDSLYTTMNKTGLEVASLTLEPIAAMNAAIPEKLRLLNLALADVGAGTSDIAVSRNGSVVAYTMATVAGDEITEAIMKQYLVDFAAAETIKHQMGGEQEITFQDILGFDHSVAPTQVRRETEPAVRALCEEIAKNITAANGEPTSAAFLVGGGSKLPGMCGFVAEYLGLPLNRVAIGGNNFMNHVISPEYELTGPEYATPLGIAISAALNLISDSFSILLNGSRAKLFRSNQLTVLDVLMMNGFSYNQLISRSGRSAVVEVNGENRVFYGGHPKVARALINGKEAAVSALVQAGDEILFEPSVHGEDARPFLYEAIPYTDVGSVFLNGAEYPVGTQVKVNGIPASPDHRLKHHDRVEYIQITTLRDLLQSAGEPAKGGWLVNGRPAEQGTVLAGGDEVTAQERGAEESISEPEDLSQQEAPVTQEPAPAISDAPVPPPAQPEAPQTDRTEDVPEKSQFALRITVNHAPQSLFPKPDGSPFYLVDMLNLVEFDLSKPEGRQIVTRVNGKDAAYLQKIEDGDEVDIHWEDPAGIQP